MGMFDTVIFLDGPLHCPAGHPLGELQTKSFPDPSMSTYLVEGGRLARAVRGPWGDGEEASSWRISGGEAVHQTRYRLEQVVPPPEVLLYAQCAACAPVLVRADAARSWGDIVAEHRLSVDFRLRFREGEPPEIERVTGGRDELMEELRDSGLRVLRDDDPLAMAHREIQRARAGSRRR